MSAAYPLHLTHVTIRELDAENKWLLTKLLNKHTKCLNHDGSNPDARTKRPTHTKMRSARSSNYDARTSLPTHTRNNETTDLSLE
jgi:hypothetical protein